MRVDLDRWLPLIKWLLAIPHYIVLLVPVIVSWFAIAITGSYPRPFFDFVVGLQTWSSRVTGYAILMVTDRCPPFSLS